MEVHAHGKKNWKQYFWEFLMLLIAVFCGFLAEKQREYYAEEQRAKDCAVGLFKDLPPIFVKIKEKYMIK